MTYGCPNGAFTSFASLRIDGQDSLFAPTSVPTNLNATTNQVVQSINGINITQRLEIVTDASTGKSTLKIRYTVHNPTSSSHSVGIRLMIDTMVDGNDTSLFRTQTDGVMTNQREYLGSAIPSTIETLATETATTRIGAVTLSGGDATTPDRVLLANYNSISSTVYDATVNPSASLGDSAYALYWSPVTIPAGESNTVVTYYGLGLGSVTPPSPPLYSYSVYIQNIQADEMIKLGRQQRCKSNGVVFLGFGKPYSPSGTFGSFAFGYDKTPNNADDPLGISLSDISTAIEKYIQGYWEATTCDQGSMTSRGLTIAISTSNSSLEGETGPDNLFLTAQHGSAWGQMINDLNATMLADGYASAIRIVAGYDAELGWSSYTPTKAWLDGYISTSNYPYYYFGSCDGCATTQSPANWDTATLDQVVRLVTPAGTMVFPQIYHDYMAQQWYNVKKRALSFGGGSDINLRGVMTNCGDTQPNSPGGEGCRFSDPRSWQDIPSEGRNDFPPSQGWQALYDTLNSLVAPDGSANSIRWKTLPYLTDIRKQVYR